MIDTNFGRRFFSMYDPDPKAHGLTEIQKVEDMGTRNAEKFGIFWTVNKIKADQPRRKENLEKILAIAFEVDTGTKESQREQIKKNIAPSMIIETKRGYHCYFFVKDFEPDADAYRDFLLDRVIPFYDADKNAADATRILRVPTFYHWKDENEPFLVRCLRLDESLVYTKKQLQTHFPMKKKEQVDIMKSHQSDLRVQDDKDLFYKIYNQNQGTLLRRLSGTDAVGFDPITFKGRKDGTYQIVVSGKSTSCWIDVNGKIGSLDGGGPTVWQWINWYQKDHKKTYELFKKHFPEFIK